MTKPIHLRNCPMCKTSPSDDGVMLTASMLIDPATGEQYHAAGYTVSCCQCGCSVSDEYLDNVVNLWNGEPEKTDPEEDQSDLEAGVNGERLLEALSELNAGGGKERELITLDQFVKNS